MIALITLAVLHRSDSCDTYGWDIIVMAVCMACLLSINNFIFLIEGLIIGEHHQNQMRVEFRLGEAQLAIGTWVGTMVAKQEVVLLSKYKITYSCQKRNKMQ